MKYNFEIERINREIKRRKVKYVILQLPDGLKPYSLNIAKQIKNAIPLIWFGTNFGGCDIPPYDFRDTLWVNFGHSPFRKKD